MPLNSSGPISLGGSTVGQSINLELGQSATATTSLNASNVRTLAGVPTGAIVMPTNFWGKSNNVPFGCATYTTAGTYSFVVPAGVSKICVVCIGSGGGGFVGLCLSGGGGGGGALSYTNCIPTTPGETLTVVVGAGTPAWNSGCNIPIPAPSGSPSSVRRGATTLVLAAGGSGGAGGSFTGPGGSAASGVGAVKYSGGNAVRSGAGAAGYAGNGANGVNSTSAGIAGTGGSAGSGSAISSRGGAGGGVGIVVQGPSGAGGTNTPPSTTSGGGGGSGGTAGTGNAGTGGLYGGGGGTHASTSSPGGASGRGAVRIIYGGTNKTYPNNSAP